MAQTIRVQWRKAHVDAMENRLEYQLPAHVLPFFQTANAPASEHSEVAVLVDWMVDASAAANVSNGRGARVLDASAAAALARKGPGGKKRKAARKHSG